MLARIFKEEQATNALNFFSNLQYALVIYFMPAFLVSTGVTEGMVGFLFALGSLVSMLLLLFTPEFLRMVGNFVFFALVTTAMSGSLLMLALAPGPFAAGYFFVVVTASWALGMLSLDEFLQADSKTAQNIGVMRALFITMANLAFMIAPIFAGHLAEGDAYGRLFLAAAVLGVPILIILSMGLSSFKDPHYHIFSIKGMWDVLKNRPSIRLSMFQKFLLYVFYGIVEVYVIVYLHDHLGYSLPDVGTMLSIALIAFVLIELPAGYLADTRIGERDILLIGFLILGISTVAMGLIGVSTFVIWTSLMFVSRVGAALVEIGGESYFFKHVKASDADEMGLYRAVAQLGLVAGPAIGSLVLLVSPIEIIFVVVGIIVLSGIPSVLEMFRRP